MPTNFSPISFKSDGKRLFFRRNTFVEGSPSQVINNIAGYIYGNLWPTGLSQRDARAHAKRKVNKAFWKARYGKPSMIRGGYGGESAIWLYKMTDTLYFVTFQERY